MELLYSEVKLLLVDLAQREATSAFANLYELFKKLQAEMKSV